MTREELVDQKESLKLNYDVAVMTQAEELKTFGEEFIRKHGIEDFIQVKVLNEDSLTPSLIFDVDKRSFNVGVEFELKADASYIASIYPRSIDYKNYYADDKLAVVMFKLLHVLVENVNDFTSFFNSPTIKACRDDMHAFRNSISSIEKFDEEAREALIKETAKSFKAGMTLINKVGKCFPILRVTAKRVYLSGYSYRNGYPRKSEWIDRAAVWVADNKWTLKS